MITAYIIRTTNIEQMTLKPGDKVPDGVVWIDLASPTIEEEYWAEEKFQVNAPTKEEMDKIEVMSPFYRDKSSHYMTATVINHADQQRIESTALTFILSPLYLITLHYFDALPLHHFVQYATRIPIIMTEPDAILTTIIEMLINGIAETLEVAGNELDILMKMVFENKTIQSVNTSQYHNTIMSKIGQTGYLISKNRESLVSLNRLLIYFSQINPNENLNKYFIQKDIRSRIKHMSREIHTLSEYASFLSNRNGFLLDATLGFLYVEQNSVIKLFTIAAAIFMPPTLIASIYGMNFANMPELNLKFGYYAVLFLMFFSALLPYLFFKKKGWL